MTTSTRPVPVAAVRIAAVLDAILRELAADRPLGLVLAGSLLASCGFCAWLFDRDFLLGTSAFWSNPRGIVGNGWADISSALSGYDFFQQDTWQLPLFHVQKLAAPGGLSIVFTDSIPWVALAGRLVFRMTGVPVNLFGLWTAFCLVASAVSLTALVAKMGQTNIAAAGMATVTGLCMPALLARWGHLGLMAHFEIMLALIFYLGNRTNGNAWRLFARAAGLILLTLWTTPYLFAMAGAIVLATILQAATFGTLRWRSAVLMAAGLGAQCGAVMILSGHLQAHSTFGTGADAPFFTMNLLAPFWPQRSGLFQALRDGIVDGTGRQYEGFSYLGGGVLLILLSTLPWQIRRLGGRMRRNPWLVGLFIAFTMFAVSNAVYLGTVRLVVLPLPAAVLQAASVFRSTGRFFWPVMYVLAAAAITAVIPRFGRRGVLLLSMAALLQWIDAAPLRNAVAMSTRAPGPLLIDLAAWRAAIEHHASVRILPPFICLSDPMSWNARIAVQLQLLAAAADRPVNSVYAARFAADCSANQPISSPAERQLSVFLNEFPGFDAMRTLSGPGRACHAGPGIVVCGDLTGQSDALVGLGGGGRQ